MEEFNMYNVRGDFLKVYPYNLLEDLFIMIKPQIEDNYYDMEYIVENIDENLNYIIEKNKRYFNDFKKNVFIKHYKDGIALTDIAKEIGYSRERIRQVINDGLRVIRNPQNFAYLTFGYDFIENKIKECKEKKEKELEEMFKTIKDKDYKIEELKLSPRPYNALKKNGIDTISQLLDYGKSFKNMRGIGRKSASEIRRKLKVIEGE